MVLNDLALVRLLSTARWRLLRREVCHATARSGLRIRRQLCLLGQQPLRRCEGPSRCNESPESRYEREVLEGEHGRCSGGWRGENRKLARHCGFESDVPLGFACSGLDWKGCGLEFLLAFN